MFFVKLTGLYHYQLSAVLGECIFSVICALNWFISCPTKRQSKPPGWSEHITQARNIFCITDEFTDHSKHQSKYLYVPPHPEEIWGENSACVLSKW